MSLLQSAIDDCGKGVDVEVSDELLLTQYVNGGDQAAFAALVERHGPLVWGVCRRILRKPTDAEDAFQAAFFILAKKAASIRRLNSIASWLHQVSRRLALRIRESDVRRPVAIPAETLDAMTRSHPAAVPEDAELLHKEIARLPVRLREPVVLCYLEGLTNREAAGRLGCPEGTIVSRLAQARARLRRRLGARGILLASGAALTSLLADSVQASSVPLHLREAAICCGNPGAASIPVRVVDLARPILKQMFWKAAAWQALWGLLLLLAAFGGWWLWGPEQAVNRRVPTTAQNFDLPQGAGTAAAAGLHWGRAAAASPEVQEALRGLQGHWTLTEWEFAGATIARDPERRQGATFDGDRYVILDVGEGGMIVRHTGRVEIDAAHPESGLDLIPDRGGDTLRMPCLYERIGQNLRLCRPAPGTSRPREFTTVPDDGLTRFTFSRD